MAGRSANRAYDTTPAAADDLAAESSGGAIGEGIGTAIKGMIDAKRSVDEMTRPWPRAAWTAAPKVKHVAPQFSAGTPARYMLVAVEIIVGVDGRVTSVSARRSAGARIRPGRSCCSEAVGIRSHWHDAARDWSGASRVQEITDEVEVAQPALARLALNIEPPIALPSRSSSIAGKARFASQRTLATLRRGILRCIHERRMVDENSASWNRIGGWFTQVDAPRRVA